MKNLRFYFSIVLLALVATITSCSKDEATKLAPTITFTPSATTFAISQDTALVYSLAITAEAEIKTFTIKKRVNETTTTNETVTATDFVGKTAYTYAYTKTVLLSDFDNATKIEYIFTVTDKDDQSVEKKITITKKGSVAAGAINTYTGKVVAAQGSSSLGSYFATSNGTVYLAAGANTNQSLIDFICYYNSGLTSLSFYSPSNSDVVNMATSTGGSLGTPWTTKNATTFVPLTISSTAFDAITDDAAILANVATLPDTKATITNGAIFGFKTAANKKGIVIITGVTGTGNSQEVTFTVKVQQ